MIVRRSVEPLCRDDLSQNWLDGFVGMYMRVFLYGKRVWMVIRDIFEPFGFKLDEWDWDIVRWG